MVMQADATSSSEYDLFLEYTYTSPSWLWLDMFIVAEGDLNKEAVGRLNLEIGSSTHDVCHNTFWDTILLEADVC